MALLDQVLGPLEIALNRAFSTSPDALQALSAEKDMVALHFRDLGWGLRIAPAPHGVQLLPGAGEARASVSTSLVGMARLMAGEDVRAMGNALTLEGDAEYAAQFMSIMRSARFDLEAELRSLLGPILNSGVGQSLSQNVGQGVTDLLSAGKQGLQSLLFGRRPSEQPNAEPTAPSAHPDGQLADSEQTHVWMDEVDHAASALDRLEARLARLEQRRGDA